MRYNLAKKSLHILFVLDLVKFAINERMTFKFYLFFCHDKCSPVDENLY